MKTSTKIIIAVVIIAAIAGAVYYFYFRNKKDSPAAIKPASEEGSSATAPATPVMPAASETFAPVTEAVRQVGIQRRAAVKALATTGGRG